MNDVIVAVVAVVAVVVGIVFVVRLLFSYFAYRAFIEILKLENERQDRLQAAYKKEIEASQARIKAIFSRSGKVGNDETDTETDIPARRN